MAKPPSRPSEEISPLELLEELDGLRDKLAAAQGNEERQLFERLARSQKDGPKGIEGLDKEIARELEELYRKLERARRFRPAPPPEFQWAILEEIIQLLLKLVWKAFFLQKMKPPPLPPLPRP